MRKNARSTIASAILALSRNKRDRPATERAFMSVLVCPNCRTPLPGEFFNSPGMSNCYSCNTPLQVHAFPALFRKLTTGKSGENMMQEGAATCFFHAQKRAIVPCDACGRFLCALCDMEVGGRHLCPQCASSGAKKGKVKDLQNRRDLYDNFALLLAIAPLPFSYLTIITAPVSLYYCAQYWNTEISVVPRSKTRFVVAIILSSLQLVGWALLLVYLLGRK